MNPALEHNRRAWDERVRRRDWYIDTATEQDFKQPLAAIDGLGWLGGDVTGRRILCLAAGGGRHGVLLAAAGAQVTVVDLSPEMLALDRKIAGERGLAITTVETSMEDLSSLSEAVFDAVIQPVSTCYVPDVVAVYLQVGRVLVSGGLYLSQHKQPASLQTRFHPASQTYVLTEPYYRQGPLPPEAETSWHREAGTQEFLHRWEELLGGLCRSGFVIEDVAEPRHAKADEAPGNFGHRSQYAPPYLAIKARRLGSIETPSPAPRLWTPGDE